VIEMSSSNSDEWEEKMIEQMLNLFNQMGMPIDKSELEDTISRIRQQFDNLGIDAESIYNSNVKMNFQGDPENFRKQMESFMNHPEGFSEIFKNMGINVQVGPDDEPAEVEVEEGQEDESDVPLEDTYLDGNSMYVTIDVSNIVDLDEGTFELILSHGGNVLQLMRRTQLRPIKSINLPQAASSVSDWNLNNGILDITFDTA
jgi:HSP20 family molecular chaperone IbpA